MSVKSFVESVVSQIVVSGQNFSFKHGERDFQNIFADEETFPVVYLDEPIQNDFEIVSSGAIQEYYPIQLMILYKTELDFTPDQHDVLIQKARLCARKFLSLANDSDQMRTIDGIKGVEVINVFDANTSGIILSCRLSFYDSTSICADYEPTEGYVNLTNSDESWSVQIENNTSYIVPNTVFQVLDQHGWNYGEYNVPSVNGGTITITALPCDLSTITVNGNEFGTVISGGTIDIPVVNGGSNPVGTIDGGQVVIGNSFVKINGTTVGDIVAEDSLSIAVKLDGVQSGVWNATDQVWEVESAPCADAIITLDSEPFLTLPSGSTTNITLQDEDGNPIDPVGSVGSAIVVPNGEEWQRPTDWLPIPTISTGEQVFYGLFAVYNVVDGNYVAFSFQGNYTVDWGDGVVENFASNATATHQYSWASVGNITSEGFRQALIKVTPQSGQNITQVNLQRAHPTLGNGRNSQFIDIVMSIPNVSGTNLTLGGTTIIFHRIVERVWIKEIGLINTCALLFYFFNNLQDVPLFNTSSVTNMSSMFQNNFKIREIPLFDTSSVTNISQMLQMCYNLQEVPLLNTSQVTNATNMLNSCFKLKSIPNFNLTNLLIATNMFQNCYFDTIPALNTPLLQNATSMFQNNFRIRRIEMTAPNLVTTTGMFQSTTSLQEVVSNGTTRGFSVQGCQLSAMALLVLANSVGNAVGSQTVITTGNPGAFSTAYITVFNAKGYTVVNA